MAVDMFLKWKRIKGESRDDKHKDQIDILSYSWGASQSATDGLRRRRWSWEGPVPGHQLLDQRQHRVSAASSLAARPASTSRAPSSQRAKPVEQQQDFLIIKLNDVLVTSYQNGGASGGDVPTDQFSLTFAQINYEFKEQKEDGSLVPGSSGGWDIKANEKV